MLYVKVIAALMGLAAFLWLCLFLLKKFNVNNVGSKKIKIEEVLFLDNKKKLVLVQYKNREYFLCIGNSFGLVVDSHERDS